MSGTNCELLAGVTKTCHCHTSYEGITHLAAAARAFDDSLDGARVDPLKDTPVRVVDCSLSVAHANPLW